MRQKPPFLTMKILVVGGGSIGLRHAKNLKTLGVSHVVVFEPDLKRRSELKAIGLKVSDSPLKESLHDVWDAVLICSPTLEHSPQIIEVLKKSIPVFVEKPVAHTEEEAKALESQSMGSLTTMVGCNMRFHPGPKKVREWVNEGRIGGILYGHFHSGSYLPEWRKSNDYKQTYSAQASQGGGCLLDCIHEIDLATWILGPITDVYCQARNTQTLGIDAEDLASLISTHKGNSTSEIHIDYVQRNYDRGCKVVGTEGTVLWNMTQKSVTLYEASKGTWSEFKEPDPWDLNQMYLEEIHTFLSCVQEKKQTEYPISEALKTLHVVLAAKRSAKNTSRVAVARTVTGNVTAGRNRLAPRFSD